MKYVLAIIGIFMAVSTVLNGVVSTKDDRECNQEMDRISIELIHIAQDFERTGNSTAAINAIRYQAERAEKFSRPR